MPQASFIFPLRQLSKKSSQLFQTPLTWTKSLEPIRQAIPLTLPHFHEHLFFVIIW